MCPLQREGTSKRNPLGRTKGGSLGGTEQAELPSFPVDLGTGVRGEVLFSLLQGCTTQSQLEREGRTAHH